MKNIIILLITLNCFSSLAKEYHVSVKGDDNNDGTFKKPLKTIMAAANKAMPGDIITVHAGTYREWINPKRGGTSDDKRIVYRAASGDKVELKGSEIISGWQQEKDGVWKVVIPNSFFGNYNPCSDLVYGDWCTNFGNSHTADVFLNGKSLYEMDKMEKVSNPVPYEKTKDKEGSTYTWYCEVDDQNTTIWANFHKINPNKELVEISTRKTCFYPDNPGINYITISGFDISQAATQWAAPTAEQIGMIASHWNKGWIIENNVIHDTKCSGITLGKERGTGQNVWSKDPSYDGSVHYIEVVFKTLRNGWNKENIGSHIVRNNEIFNCEQTGICGSMGLAFSVIENNHIYNIHQKNQFTGAELAGIKIHGGIDTRVEKNRIHDVGAFGCWFDWMSQGTRVSKNLLYRNDRYDLFFEVNHGPFLVDNNIMLSAKCLDNQSEGGAFVHNLFVGEVMIWCEPGRFTPYHLAHSTEIAGLATVRAGDDRYYNNIFIGNGKNDRLRYGLSIFNKTEETAQKGKFNIKDHWPVWINDNIYYNGALPYEREMNFIENSDFNPGVELIEEKDAVYLQFATDESFFNAKTQFVATDFLGKTKMTREGFVNPDGSPLKIDTDYLGNKRNAANPSPGVFEIKNKGKRKIKVW